MVLFIFSHVETHLAILFQELTLSTGCYFCCDSSNPMTEGSFMHFLFFCIIKKRVKQLGKDCRVIKKRAGGREVKGREIPSAIGSFHWCS